MKKAEIKMRDKTAGWLIENEEGYLFYYDESYLNSADPEAISRTLPIDAGPFKSNILFPFFDGLIPEGWLLNIAQKTWKLNLRDRMSLLMACCKDCIGAVSVFPVVIEDK